MKYSIVIPVYNVEAYIVKCLDSLVNQTYANYEVIIVNDGSPDNSDQIIKEYIDKDKRFMMYLKENGGLSDARNYGVNKAKGDYLIFIDGDDYVDINYLKAINEVLEKKKDIEVLKTKLIMVDDNGTLIGKEKGLDISDYVTFKDLTKLEFLEPAWSYVYNLKYFKTNKFKYALGMVHEDYGLTPEILIKANKIYYLNYYAYYYVQRENSIMSSNSYNKEVKKAYDMLKQYDRLLSLDLSNVSEENRNLYYSFLTNAVILKPYTLKGKERRDFLVQLKKRKVYTHLLDDTLKRKIKKMIFRISPMSYIYLRVKLNK